MDRDVNSLFKPRVEVVILCLLKANLQIIKW